MEPEREGLVLLLLEQGNRTQAIQLYREEAGVDLFDARAAVAQLSRHHGVDSRRGGWVPLLVLVFCGLLGCAVAFS